MRELARADRRPGEIAERLPGLSRTTAQERLRALALLGAVSRQRVSGMPARSTYALTRAGRALAHVVAAASRWQERWHPGGAGPPIVGRPPEVLALLATDWVLAILHELSAGPLHVAALEERLDGISHGTLEQRLARMADGRLIERSAGARSTRHGILPGGCLVVRVLTPLARWDWQWGSLVRWAPVCDPAGMIRLALPAVRPRARLAGRCRIVLDPRAPSERALTLAVEARRVRIEPAPRTDEAPAATGHAASPVWLQACAGARREGIVCDGDTELLDGVVDALAVVVGG